MPAKGDYSTRITLLDKTPDIADYGSGFGTGNPRDDRVQYGVNIAVQDKARDGSWGKITVWNATSLGNLTMKVDQDKASPGDTLKYQLKVRNISPAPQTYSVSDLLPANLKFLRGNYYHKSTNSIEWSGALRPNESKTIEFSVMVNRDTPLDTVIENKATLSDDANGAVASPSTTIVKDNHPHPHYDD